MNNSRNNVKTQFSENDFKDILIRQIKSGAASEYGSYDDYSENDLNALISFEDSLLQSNGYKPLDQKSFSDKIKNIFGRTIDYSSALNYLKIDTYEPCNKDLVFNALSADNQNIYVSKKNKIITFFYPLPSIINYQKLYPNLSEYEKSPINLETNDGNQTIAQWKDLPNLIQTQKNNSQFVVTLNMYLFNDNKAHYKWLILNDQNFMMNLVKSFGYTDDTQLLKWVIEKTKFEKNNPQDFGKLFWIKKCDGTVKIHTNTFKVLQQIYTPDIQNDMSNDNRFLLNNIQNYIEYFADNKERGISNENKVKILANIAYFTEQYKYDKRFVSGHGDGSRIMGRLRFFLNQDDIKILEKNNYFNLPKFKEWWDNADYDEYFVEECEYNGTCGPDNKPMNITEWRKQHPKK
ncbi:hypothetical protein [Chryseobacterium endalhagicum]|nr:hypothetical protein [Chryseobacterium endalhagicum]